MMLLSIVTCIGVVSIVVWFFIGTWIFVSWVKNVNFYDERITRLFRRIDSLEKKLFDVTLSIQKLEEMTKAGLIKRRIR